jgi:hypothetical protein
MKLLTQKNSHSDLIPDELDGMVDEEDIRPTLNSWTERTAEDLWVLGDEVEQSLPGDLEFAPWHEEELIEEHGFQGIPELLEMRGPISSLARQLQRDDTGERLLHGLKNGSHSILQSQRILKLIKAKKPLLPQHRRNPSWIELRIGSLGLLHRFGLGIGCVHHISNELGKIGKNRYRINAGGVASIG